MYVSRYCLFTGVTYVQFYFLEVVHLGRMAFKLGKINGLTTDIRGCYRNNKIIMMDKNTTAKNLITEQNSVNKDVRETEGICMWNFSHMYKCV